MTSQESARRRWLFGPLPDVFFGVGAAYGVVFLLLCSAGAKMQALLPLGVMHLLSVFLSTPHYGATLLRVYERGEDRRAYSVFGTYVTLALGLAFYWGLQNPIVGAWIFTLYLTWSPWHYTGQNYGIALMYLSRRGVSLTPSAKRLLHASFVLSYVITFLFIHGPVTDSGGYEPGQIQYLSLGIPALLADFGLVVTTLAYLATVGATLVLLRRSGAGRNLFPTLGLMGTQALWFVLPALVKNWKPYGSLLPFSIEHGQYVFTWIALGHAVQYLWITSYFAINSKRAIGQRSFYAKALAAGVAIWTIPALVFAPGGLGRIPFDAGLSAMVAAIVNLHHFILDGVIWKLRDGRIARILIRTAQPSESAGEAAEPRRRLRLWPAFAVAGAVSLAVSVLGAWEQEFGVPRALARQDLSRAHAGAERLAWIGRDSTTRREEIGVRALHQGDLELAQQEFERSIRFFPTSRGWMRLGESLAAQGKWPEAVDAYGEALRLDPHNLEAELLAGLAAVELGRTESAREVLARTEALPQRSADYT
jgi:tetratricopeptide (TPR) repeat protein